MDEHGVLVDQPPTFAQNTDTLINLYTKHMVLSGEYLTQAIAFTT
jgi:hypothetical protein